MTSDRQIHLLNNSLKGCSCIRCGALLTVGDYFEGCPSCLSAGRPSSVKSEYSALPSTIAKPGARGMARYADWLPYSSWVSLGEGATPCVSVPALAAETSSARVLVKNEGQNPSGSHKDRASCLTVTRALDAGARRIVAASSGNAGASLALYAAAAGLECTIVVTAAPPPILRRAITQAGADLVEVEDSFQRWDMVAKMAREEGCFPATNYLNPPVGSNHFGVEGLTSIAYELAEQAGDGVDAILVPTSRGDLVWAIFEGFRRLKAAGHIKRIPKLFVVEPFPRLSMVLDGADQTGSFPGATALFSIAGSTVTYQSVEAVQQSGGGAVVVDDAAVIRDAKRFAQHGFHLELSAAATLTGLEALRCNGAIAADETVVLIATSHGYKDLPTPIAAQ
ncbi:MAG: pyridoxal-phosphate dependent enzyme [Sphingomonadaceae bacterium]|nr:pyridoxal-phosphate dependent enzyme [Sphingomonadaceae bacterium]